jgi:hypothetical protein
MSQDYRLTELYKQIYSTKKPEETSSVKNLYEAYKQVNLYETKSLIEEAVKKMTDKNLESRYINRIADAIATEKELTFINRKNESTDVVASILVNGEEWSLENWQRWAVKCFADKKGALVQKTSFKLSSGEVFEIKDLVKTDALSKAIINVGDAAEAILGAAITAKFKIGGKDITPSNIVEVLKVAVDEKQYVTTTNYNLPGVAEDQIMFNLSLNRVAIKGLKSLLEEPDPLSEKISKFRLVWESDVSPKNVKSIQNLFFSAAIYANKNLKIKQAIDKAKNEKRKNSIQIISDGGEAANQSITKVDLTLVYDGVKMRLLSLKAGKVKQFGQVSGGTFSRLNEFFLSTLGIQIDPNLETAYKFKPSSDPDYKEFNYNINGPGPKPIANLYKYVEKTLSQKLTKQDDYEEYDVISALYNAIRHHATLNQEGVSMVVLSSDAKLGYKELSFGQELLKALQNYTFSVVNKTDGKNHKIIVVGKLKPTKQPELKQKAQKAEKPLPASKNLLFQIRTFAQSKAIRNVIEMGDLLKDLADVEKIEQQSIDKK